MPALIATVRIDLSGLQKYRAELDNQLQHKSTGPITKAFKQWGAVYRSFIKERFDVYSRGGGDWPDLADSTKRARRGPRGTSKSKVDSRKKAGKLRSRIHRLGKQLSALNRKPAKRGKTIKTANRRKKIVEQIKRAKSSFKKNKDLSNRKFSILRDTGTLFAALSPVFASRPGQIEENIPYGINVGYGGASAHPSAKKATIADIANYHQTGAGHLPVRKIIVSPPETVTQQMSVIMQRAIDSLPTD